MKFRDPETGDIYDSISDAWLYWTCGSSRMCETGSEKQRACRFRETLCHPSWCRENPAEAARLMGYEVVEDGTAVRYMCCDCAHGGPICDFNENEDCPNHKDDGSCWVPYNAITDDSKDEPMEETKKPLSQWTLGEVRAECRKHQPVCEGCPLEGRLEVCGGAPRNPEEWKLEDKPRWTEEDIEDAKAILRIFRSHNLTWVARQEEGPVWAFSAEPTLTGGVFRSGANGLRISKALLPSLAPGQKARLADIIGAKDG